MARINKSKGRRGAELLEFTLAILPLLMMIFLLLDACWGMFVKSTLAFAVHAGLRQGITITGTQATAAGSNLTAMVKDTVQRNAMGLLAGSTGLARIKVNYFQPPVPGSTAAAVDVSTVSNGNAPLNVMQVSIQGFPLRPLIPRLYGLRGAGSVDASATVINAVAADLIEPSRDPPLIGPAP